MNACYTLLEYFLYSLKYSITHFYIFAKIFICINGLLSLLGEKNQLVFQKMALVNICTDRLLFWRIPTGIKTRMPKKALADVSAAGTRHPHMWYSHNWQWERSLESALALALVCLFNFIFYLVNKTEKPNVPIQCVSWTRRVARVGRRQNFPVNTASTQCNFKL